MAPPVELAVESEVEFWAKSAGGKTTIDTIRKTSRRRNAR
jgi:hypothetical protein